MESIVTTPIPLPRRDPSDEDMQGASREKKPARRRYRTAATLFSVW